MIFPLFLFLKNIYLVKFRLFVAWPLYEFELDLLPHVWMWNRHESILICHTRRTLEGSRLHVTVALIFPSFFQVRDQ